MKRELRDLFYSTFPKSTYLQVHDGNHSLMITAPHGGGMRPRSIPRRTYGKVKMDTYTRRITNSLLKEFRNPIKPYSVISDLHRSRLDLNRDIVEAAQGNLTAENVWREWDFYMRTMQRKLRRRYKNSLYIDIHSHNHGDYFELGYNMKADDYLELMTTRTTNASTTLDTLEASPYDMIFGHHSIKDSLEQFDFEVLTPKNDYVYFNGGRNIEVYSGDGIGAIQIECPVSILKSGRYMREKVVYALYYSIQAFMNTFVSTRFN